MSDLMAYGEQSQPADDEGLAPTDPGLGHASAPAPVAPDVDPTPAYPHLTTEFFAWLWFASEREGGSLFLGDPDEGGFGAVDFWVDERLSFRYPDDEKVRAVLTGENAAATLEARAALLGGKVVRDLRLALRREEREYTVTLRGAHLDLQGAKLPPHAVDGEDELLYERMFLYEDLWHVLGALYRAFAEERTSVEWGTETLPAMRAWAAEASASGG